MKFGFRLLAFTALSAPLFLSTPSFADDDSTKIPVPPPPTGSSADNSAHTVENLDKAKAAYNAGHYKEALSDIEQAQHGIRAKHAELYRAVLPAAPAGWQATDNPESTLNLPAAGGMILVGRKYTANGNTVVLTYVVDASPAILVAFMTPPSATATSDTATFSFLDIKGNKALYKEGTTAKTGLPTHSLNVVASPVAVLINSTSLDKDTLSKFAGLIDYEALKNVK